MDTDRILYRRRISNIFAFEYEMHKIGSLGMEMKRGMEDVLREEEDYGGQCIKREVMEI
jgi:hypothetical protein